jgi:hypothetical protein
VAAQLGISSDKLFCVNGNFNIAGVHRRRCHKKIKSSLQKDGGVEFLKTIQGERFVAMLKQINGSMGATEEAFNKVMNTP